MGQWKDLNSRRVLDAGKFLSVDLRDVQTPRGKVVKDWARVTCPDYVIVVPVDTQSRVLCFEVDKYAVGEPSLSFVAGYVESGEKPEQSAIRELQEELTMKVDETKGSWLKLGEFVTEANRFVSRGHHYLARGIVPTESKFSDDLEDLRPVSLTIDEFERAIDERRFKVGGWAAAALYALFEIKKLRRE